MDEQIPTGARWDEVLREQIETCAAMVVVLSEHAAASDWVAKEIRHARLLGKAIFPLQLSNGIVEQLKSIQAEDVSDGRMPAMAFVERLHAFVSRRRVLIYSDGVVPEAADCFQLRDVADIIDSAVAVGGAEIEHGGAAKVLSGPGGVGKTQLAAAVARRARDNAEAEILLWIMATSRAAVVAAYTRAAARLIGVDPGHPDHGPTAFLHYLRQTKNSWLVVLDDLADPGDLDGLWPPRASHGRVLVTTRRTDSSLRARGALIPIGLFTPAEARDYLTEKFADRRYCLDGADELIDDLGLLPLALSHAAAYISDRNLTCASYRRRFAKGRTLDELTPEASPDDYGRPLTLTISLAVDAANALPPRRSCATSDQAPKSA